MKITTIQITAESPVYVADPGPYGLDVKQFQAGDILTVSDPLDGSREDMDYKISVDTAVDLLSKGQAEPYTPVGEAEELEPSDSPA